MKVTCQNCKRELQMPQCAPGTMLVCPACKQWTQVPTSSAEQWFMASGKQKLGPFSLGQLKLQASSGKLQPADMLLKAGATKWLRAGELAGLFPPAHPPAPVPSRRSEPVRKQGFPATVVNRSKALHRNLQGNTISPVAIGIAVLGLLFVLSTVVVGALFLLIILTKPAPPSSDNDGSVPQANGSAPSVPPHTVPPSPPAKNKDKPVTTDTVTPPADKDKTTVTTDKDKTTVEKDKDKPVTTDKPVTPPADKDKTAVTTDEDNSTVEKDKDKPVTIDKFTDKSPVTIVKSSKGDGDRQVWRKSGNGHSG